MNSSIWERWGRGWLGPEVMSTGCLSVVTASIAISRDFGWILFGMVLVMFLLLLTLVCMGWTIVKRRGGRSIAVAMLILLATIPVAWLTRMAWDWTSVVLWSASHRQQLVAASGKDVIVTGWADYGWAGGSTFAYVINDARDESGSPAGAEAWRQRLKLDCPVTGSQRIWRGLYLVETTDCPFDGIALPD